MTVYYAVCICVCATKHNTLRHQSICLKCCSVIILPLYLFCYFGAKNKCPHTAFGLIIFVEHTFYFKNVMFCNNYSLYCLSLINFSLMNVRVNIINHNK